MIHDDPQPLLPFKKKLKAKRGAKKARKPRSSPHIYEPPPPVDLPALLGDMVTDTGWAIVPEASRPHRSVDTYHRTIRIARPDVRHDERHAIEKYLMETAPAERRRWLDQPRHEPATTYTARCVTDAFYPPGLPGILPETTAWMETSTPERRMVGDHRYRRELVLDRALTPEERPVFEMWLFDQDGGCPGYCDHRLTGAGVRWVAFTTCDSS